MLSKPSHVALRAGIRVNAAAVLAGRCWGSVTASRFAPVAATTTDHWSRGHGACRSFIHRTLEDIRAAGNVKEAAMKTWESRRYLLREDGMGCVCGGRWQWPPCGLTSVAAQALQILLPRDHLASRPKHAHLVRPCVRRGCGACPACCARLTVACGWPWAGIATMWRRCW